MSRTSVGLGRVVANQVDIFSAPLNAYQRPGTVPGVIQCHGSGRIATDIGNFLSTGEYPIYDALRQRYCVALGDFDYNAWGNDTAIADVDAMRTWMQSTMGAKPGKVALVGASMGTVTALNYAMAHPDRVACVAVFIPACNVQGHPTFTGAVNTAYGGSYNDATMGPMHNPIKYAASFPTSIPVKLWYSSGDQTALPQYVEQFAAACPSATAVKVSTTLDHTQAAIAAAPIADVLAFIGANLT